MAQHDALIAQAGVTIEMPASTQPPEAGSAASKAASTPANTENTKAGDTPNMNDRESLRVDPTTSTMPNAPQPEFESIQAHSENDPFDFLMNASRDPSLLLLLGGPVLILAILLLIIAVVTIIRRRRDRSRLDQAIVQSENEPLTAGELQEEPEGKPYKVPPELQGEEPKRHLRVIHPDKAPISGKPEAAALTPKDLVSGDVEDVRNTDQTSWLARLRGGLSKTRDSLQKSLTGIFSGQTRIDEKMLDQLHEVLFRADIGVQTADKLVAQVRTELKGETISSMEQVGDLLKKEARAILESPSGSLNHAASGPWVILVVGVNGVGKTTTIGKLAAHFIADGKKVLLAAGDTFRAAAIEQLQVWGERLGVDVIRHQQGSDPAAVAYDGVKAAIARKADVLIIDTAGRLHSKQELMAELGKINRVIGKDLPGAPHETWLVLDATTGQNAVMQVKAFSDVVKVSGLVVTKLDGTAKGGVIIGIADQFKLPIRYVGVGEKAADLRRFDAVEYVDSLF